MYSGYMVYHGFRLPQQRGYNINEFLITSLDMYTPVLANESAFSFHFLGIYTKSTETVAITFLISSTIDSNIHGGCESP